MICKLSKLASASDIDTCDCPVAHVVGRSDSAKSGAPSTNGEIEPIMHKKSILKMSHFIKPPRSCMNLILLRRILRRVWGEFTSMRRLRSAKSGTKCNFIARPSYLLKGCNYD